MSTWDQDRKFVLEALERHETKLDKILERLWRQEVKVAGIAALSALVVAAVMKLIF